MRKLLSLSKILKYNGQRWSSSFNSRIRNVGIMAHIDAGKTTTTERMLLYSGYMMNAGDVNDGDTVMDYMEQERNRGITITAAAITFPWRGHQINLIDTPGHVDFTIEVERALRVLDCGVVILDASAGVEAQTLTVWRQADRNSIPRIAFLNKMDKSNASFERCLESMKKKLSVAVIPIQVPLGEGKTFRGILDLVTSDLVEWPQNSKDQGQSYRRVRLDEDVSDPKLEEYRKTYIKERRKMIESLSDYDDELADVVLSDETGNYNNISQEALKKAIKRVVSQPSAIISLCGSSFKNIAVQPLLDAIVDYLPSPDEIHHDFLSHYTSKDFCGMAFKIINHPQKGLLTFIRVYNGMLSEGDTIYNVTLQKYEKVAKLFIAFADDFKQVKFVDSGQIVVAVGLKETVTGDTILASKKLAEGLPSSNALPGVLVPDPVFFCTIEPPSISTQRQLDAALSFLAKEDPSLRVSFDSESGQTVLAGMGELHLEVIRERIRTEYKLDADIGRLMIAYKETPTTPAKETCCFERRIGDKLHKVTLTIGVSPLHGKEGCSEGPTWSFSHQQGVTMNSDTIKPWHLKAIEKGFVNAFNLGPILGYAIVSCSFQIYELIVERGTSEAILSSAVMAGVQSVLKAAEVTLLEPVMKLTILADPKFKQTIYQDLLRKRGCIEFDDQEISKEHLIELTAHVPLAELRGFSTHLRTLTSGNAFFGMELSHYQMLNEDEKNNAIEDVTGFRPA